VRTVLLYIPQNSTCHISIVQEVIKLTTKALFIKAKPVWMVDGRGTCSISPTREHDHRFGRVKRRVMMTGKESSTKDEGILWIYLISTPPLLVVELTKPNSAAMGEGATAGPIQDGIQS